MSCCVLGAFGAFWLVFVAATLIGDAMSMEARDMLLGLAMGTLVVAPFFGLGWTARRWPRATGIGLLVVSVALLAIFGRRKPGLEWSTTAMTALLLGGPFLVCGLALLFGWGAEPIANEA